MAEATATKKVLAELESLYLVLLNREREHLPEKEICEDAQRILALLPSRVSGLKVGDVTYFRKGEYKSHEKVLRLENVRFIFQGKFP